MEENREKNKNIDCKIGYIALLDMSDEEFELLLDYFEYKKKSPCVRYLASLVGKDTFLEMLDLFAGDQFKIPMRNESIKIINYVSIYNYLKQRDFTEEAYAKARGLFKRKTESLQSIVNSINDMSVDTEEESYEVE